MSRRWITQGTRSRAQSLERSRGATVPCGPYYYRVTPGEGTDDEPAPEYFPKPGQSTLKGLEDAISRAAWLSMGHGRQIVIRVRPDDAERPVRWYNGGGEEMGLVTSVR